MTGLARDIQGVLVVYGQLVRLRTVAVFATEPADAHRRMDALTQDRMVIVHMAVGARHAVAHMFVYSVRGVLQRGAHVALLHVIATASREVTAAAVRTRAGADTLGHQLQINTLGNIACGLGGLLVARCWVRMTHHTVDLGDVIDVEVGTVVAIAGMALAAPSLIPGHRDAEVIDEVLLADLHASLVALQVRRRAKPAIVRAVDHVLCCR